MGVCTFAQPTDYFSVFFYTTVWTPAKNQLFRYYKRATPASTTWTSGHDHGQWHDDMASSGRLHCIHTDTCWQLWGPLAHMCSSCSSIMRQRPPFTSVGTALNLMTYSLRTFERIAQLTNVNLLLSWWPRTDWVWTLPDCQASWFWFLTLTVSGSSGRFFDGSCSRSVQKYLKTYMYIARVNKKQASQKQTNFYRTDNINVLYNT